VVAVDDAIRDITQDVLASFGCATVPSSEHEIRDGLTSSVEIEGTSRATLAVRVSSSLVCTLALGLLRDQREAPTTEDAEDLVGEIAHMIGGNLKSVLPGPNRVSIPVAGDGPAGTTQLTTGASRPPPSAPTTAVPAQTTLAFDCEAGRFAVTVTFHDQEEKLR
jgi:chemotaxis protein CheX